MNKKNDIKFCLVGRGSIGSRHVKNLKSLSYNNIIAYSETIDTTKDEQYENKYGIKTLNNLDDVRKENPDAFIIANPTAMHIKYIQLAIEMGSHVFVEKPLSNTLDGVDGLIETIRNKNLVFFIANNFRFHPAFIKIKELIENCSLGDIYFATIMAGQYLPDWHPMEDYRQSYSARKNLGGGAVLTLEHEIDYAYWFFGKFKSIKSYVKKISSLDIDVEDLASIIIETQKHQLIEIHLDYLQRPPKRSIQIATPYSILTLMMPYKVL
ncbi:oxidoreductase domain-containing protein, partial [Candidatus Magnetoovum chiemensis]